MAKRKAERPTNHWQPRTSHAGATCTRNQSITHQAPIRPLSYPTERLTAHTHTSRALRAQSLAESYAPHAASPLTYCRCSSCPQTSLLFLSLSPCAPHYHAIAKL
eukprot:scaffold12211_cov116-Isochrysis_galbana.AAC.1